MDVEKGKEKSSESNYRMSESMVSGLKSIVSRISSRFKTLIPFGFGTTTREVEELKNKPVCNNLGSVEDTLRVDSFNAKNGGQLRVEVPYNCRPEIQEESEMNNSPGPVRARSLAQEIVESVLEEAENSLNGDGGSSVAFDPNKLPTSMDTMEVEIEVDDRTVDEPNSACVELVKRCNADADGIIPYYSVIATAAEESAPTFQMANEDAVNENEEPDHKVVIIEPTDVDFEDNDMEISVLPAPAWSMGIIHESQNNPTQLEDSRNTHENASCKQHQQPPDLPEVYRTGERDEKNSLSVDHQIPVVLVERLDVEDLQQESPVFPVMSQNQLKLTAYTVPMASSKKPLTRNRESQKILPVPVYSATTEEAGAYSRAITNTTVELKQTPLVVVEQLDPKVMAKYSRSCKQTVPNTKPAGIQVSTSSSSGIPVRKDHKFLTKVCKPYVDLKRTVGGERKSTATATSSASGDEHDEDSDVTEIMAKGSCSVPSPFKKSKSTK